MIYKNLIPNDKVLNQLKKIIEQETIPNAFLLYGNRGIGKTAHAIELSASLLCKNPINNFACSECISCKKIKINQHENINFILPISQKKKTSKGKSILDSLTNEEIDDIKKKLNEKSINPYFDISDNKVQSISINAIREIRKDMSLSSLNNSWKIHIIIDSEKLCYPRQEAANALLKMLEEPHEKNLFILCTSNVSQIIDTISSRCFKLHFSTLSNESIKSYLIKTHSLSQKKAEIISNISSGNMILANQINNIYEILLKDFNQIINIIVQNNINEWIKFVSKFPNKNYSFIIVLELLELFFLDIIILDKTKEKNRIKFKLFINEMNRYINKYRNINWNECVETINNCKININKNSFLNFTAISLLLELNKNLTNDNFLKNELKNYQL